MASHMPLLLSLRVLQTETTMSRRILFIKNSSRALVELSRRRKPLTSPQGFFEIKVTEAEDCLNCSSRHLSL